MFGLQVLYFGFYIPVSEVSFQSSVSRFQIPELDLSWEMGAGGTELGAGSWELSSGNQCEGSWENRAGPQMTIDIQSLNKNPLGERNEGKKPAWIIK